MSSLSRVQPKIHSHCMTKQPTVINVNDDDHIVEERSSRHGPGGFPPERGGGFSPV